MHPLILRLNKAGQPMGWVDWQEAACLYTRDMVVWVAGDHTIRIRGGMSRARGRHSYLDLNSIVATRGEVRGEESFVPHLTNTELFRRDQYICLYCGDQHRAQALTRDHVLPRSRGGTDSWNNVATACKRCNQRKDARTPEEAGMPLLAVPFTPNRAEYLILRNRRILADQMAFLQTAVKSLPRA